MLNNRPLTYCDIQLPVLTPNIMILGKSTRVPKFDPSDVEDCDLRKRAKDVKIHSGEDGSQSI